MVGDDIKVLKESPKVLQLKAAPEREPKWLVWGLRFAVYAIPLGFLLYVLYWNFLPFGYEKTFAIDVGSEGDTTPGEFYLEPSRDLSERMSMTTPAGEVVTYRELNGIAYAVFKPKAVLKNAEITVSVEGDGVSIIPPVIDFDPDSVEWDYAWDFTQDKTPGELGLVGNAYPFDDCMYFDGTSRLELPGSADMFESGPFTVYAEWIPQDNTSDFQQIVGHYNWELLQNNNNVRFLVGRMNSPLGVFHSIDYPVTPDFFNSKHYLLAIYSPSENGYIELFIDGNFAGRSYFGLSTIWRAYNEDRNITLGKSDHGVAQPFIGCVQALSIDSKETSYHTRNASYKGAVNNIVRFPVITTTATQSLRKVDLRVHGK